jgi:hypothetical protein
MDYKELIGPLAKTVGEVPKTAVVRALRQHTVADCERRLQRLTATTAEALGTKLDRGDWIEQEGRTVTYLPELGRAAVFHASGALEMHMGIAPMEGLFDTIEERDVLTDLVGETAKRLRIHDWVGSGERLDFEHLFQIKAAAADREGRVTEPVLCRAVGAFRHSIEGIPVLGPASVAVKVAAKGILDSLSIQVREATSEVIDETTVAPPEEGAREIVRQLESLMGRSKTTSGAELARPRWMRLGYLALSRRTRQRVLAPMYVAQIDVESEQEAQGYLLVARATERTYLRIPTRGSDEPSVPVTRAEAYGQPAKAGRTRAVGA